MEEILDKLVKEIHDSDVYGIFVETGAGQPVANALFNVAGASKTVYYAKSPYHKEIQHNHYGFVGRSVSLEFVQHVLGNVDAFDVENSNADINTILVSSFQLGDGNSVVSHGWIGFKYKDFIRYYHITLPATFNRELCIKSIANIGLAMLSWRDEQPMQDCYIDAIHDAKGNHLLKETITVANKSTLNAPLVINNGELKRLEDIFRDKEQIVLFKGSFNPIHIGHDYIMKNVESKYPNSGRAYAISLETYEKGEVDYDDLIDRVSKLNELGYPVVIFKSGWFHANVNTMRVRGFKQKIVMPLGSDTVNRLLSTTYNITTHGAESNTVRNECIRFMDDFSNVVFEYSNRPGAPVDNAINDGALRKYFSLLSEDQTAISSTQIRELIAQGKINEIKKYLPEAVYKHYIL